LKRSLTKKITSNAIDSIYDSAIKAGDSGGKLLGAGGGGFMLFIAKPELHDSIKEKLKDLLYVSFKFENNGSSIFFCQA
jgi:D-glycero-alpha-D-manno-heptose-7-phosphate kinase